MLAQCRSLGDGRLHFQHGPMDIVLGAEGDTAAVRQAHAQIGKVRYAVNGAAQPPDATGTLRLTYGRIEGTDVPGQRWGPFTTFAGLWDRATGSAPFDVAPKLLAAKDRIDPNAVMDMAVSTDTIGGSSGSPVVNAAGEAEVTLSRNASGHYVGTLQLNGVDVVFLLDTGATVVAVSPEVAKRTGMPQGQPYQVNTANGITTAYQSEITELRLGDIVFQL